jgi:hypothetical protein
LAACCPAFSKGDAGFFIWFRQENTMAKEQKRGNRETRKPKSAKPAAPVASTTSLVRGALTPIVPPKKKG